MIRRMTDAVERFRQRIAASDAAVPEELVPVVAALWEPLLTALDEVASSHLAVEPFAVSRLVDDASR
jgi:hypothetical protein